jgi:cyclopropane fatty-acyl-phospholipid synthase-like methyltransferase
MIKGLAPGTILQFMFIKNRLNKIIGNNKNFIEVGSGNGHLSNLLLNNYYNGFGVDLNASACQNNAMLNEEHIKLKKYSIHNGDFNDQEKKNFDFLISSMVIEHINDEDLKIFIANAKKIIKTDGKLIFLVPSNMAAWGIEDDIAGHVKRYTFNDIDDLAANNELKVDYKCGLNYPVSNWLLKLSNRIVNKNEAHLKSKTELEKTIYTGNRNVKYKTVFPAYLNIVLNEIVLLPFYWLQRLNANNQKSLVMYFELSIK